MSMVMLRALVQKRYATNVRELSVLLWRAVEQSTGTELDLDLDLDGPTEAIECESPDEPSSDVDDVVTTTTTTGLGASDIQRCLDAHNGSIEETWRVLGLASRHVLFRLIRKHGLEVRRRGR
jgi:transcriptional regulator with GAF, ATPase, and Fis domain